MKTRGRPRAPDTQVEDEFLKNKKKANKDAEKIVENWETDLKELREELEESEEYEEGLDM